MDSRISSSESASRLPSSLSFPHNEKKKNLISASASFVSFGGADGSMEPTRALLNIPSRGSRSWTTSSGDLGLLNDADEVEDRSVFVHEYNKLAKQSGIRVLVAEDVELTKDDDNRSRRGWFQRLFRPNSSRPASAPKPNAQPKPHHRRSTSELAYFIHSKREQPKSLDLLSMVRLSGKSAFFLPSEYSACSLILPTCLRAPAQFLVQHPNTRGIFRISGSMKVINAICDYYCHMDKGDFNIANTVRYASLPAHIPYSAHDIASVFKRLLGMIPGGILGSLSLFDAFVAIHSQLAGMPEYPRTRQTKLRARLIALAIGTISSQYRRELICAVFGLLSLIGRVAETTPREDASGRPMPTSDLVGYTALGIIFGPLLIGDLLTKYSMQLAVPDSGMIVLPPVTQKIHRNTHRINSRDNPLTTPPSVDKILVVNEITEMLIANWRDVVRQMKSLGVHQRKLDSVIPSSKPKLRQSASESFVLRVPAGFERQSEIIEGTSKLRAASPEPLTPTGHLSRTRSRCQSKKTIHDAKIAILSPAAEESADEAANTPLRKSGESKPRNFIGKLGKFSNGETQTELDTGRVSLDLVPPRASSANHHSQPTMRISSSTQTEHIPQPNEVASAKSLNKGRNLEVRARRLARLRKRKHPTTTTTNKEAIVSTLGSTIDIPSSDHLTPIQINPKSLLKTPDTRANSQSPSRESPLKSRGSTVLTGSSTIGRLSNSVDLKHITSYIISSSTGSPRRISLEGCPSFESRLLEKKHSVKALAAMFERHDVTPGSSRVNSQGPETPISGKPDLSQASTGSTRKGIVRESVSTSVWSNGIRLKSPRTIVVRHSFTDGGLLGLKEGDKRKLHQKSSFQSMPAQSPNPLRSKPNLTTRTGTERNPKANGQTLANTYSSRNVPLQNNPDIKNTFAALCTVISRLQQLLTEATGEADDLRKQLKIERRLMANLLQGEPSLAKSDGFQSKLKEEAVENKMKAFGRLTAKLRDIQNDVPFEGAARRSKNHADIVPMTRNISQRSTVSQRVRFKEHISEDGQKALGGNDGTIQHFDTENAGSISPNALDSIYNEVAELWAAARALLDDEESTMALIPVG